MLVAAAVRAAVSTMKPCTWAQLKPPASRTAFVARRRRIDAAGLLPRRHFFFGAPDSSPPLPLPLPPPPPPSPNPTLPPPAAPPSSCSDSAALSSEEVSPIKVCSLSLPEVPPASTPWASVCACPDVDADTDADVCATATTGLVAGTAADDSNGAGARAGTDAGCSLDVPAPMSGVASTLSSAASAACTTAAQKPSGSGPSVGVREQ